MNCAELSTLIRLPCWSVTFWVLSALLALHAVDGRVIPFDQDRIQTMDQAAEIRSICTLAYGPIEVRTTNPQDESGDSFFLPIDFGSRFGIRRNEKPGNRRALVKMGNKNMLTLTEFSPRLNLVRSSLLRAWTTSVSTASRFPSSCRIFALRAWPQCPPAHNDGRPLFSSVER